MADINLKEKATDLVAERFFLESKRDLVTNDFFEFEGVNTVKVYTVTTSEMVDYNRKDLTNTLNRYGNAKPLDATTKSYTLSRDRAFTYVLDALDVDETEGMQPATTLIRQISEVVIPEVDSWTFSKMAENAGTKAKAVAITEANIFELILKGNEVLDDNMVPESERCLIVTPQVYTFLKRSKDFLTTSTVADELRIKGVVSEIDNLKVIKVPKSRLPQGFGFMICHRSATCTPVKLASYTIHEDPPGISGHLVEGRINYDTFVIQNKEKGIYYQPITV